MHFLLRRLSHSYTHPFNLFHSLYLSNTYSPSGGSPGLVVMGGDSNYKGREFESQCHTLDGHFSHWFVVKTVLFVWKDEINEKEAGVGPYLKKLTVSLSKTHTLCLSQIHSLSLTHLHFLFQSISYSHLLPPSLSLSDTLWLCLSIRHKLTQFMPTIFSHSQTRFTYLILISPYFILDELLLFSLFLPQVFVLYFSNMWSISQLIHLIL